MSVQIDADQFQTLVRDSLLLTEKNYEKWNWDIISELLDGPLLNPKRYEEAVNSKFLKKLMTFFLPLAGQFAECKKVTLTIQPNNPNLAIDTALRSNSNMETPTPVSAAN